jgi:hypothetical protein
MEAAPDRCERPNPPAAPLQDQRTMAITPSPASKPRRLRAAAPHGNGGASSLLRLSRAGGTLPSGAALDGWVTRAAALLDEPALPMITPLTPSTLVLR